MNNIGDRIIEIRKENKLSQDEFGKIIGLGRSTIGCYESNARNISNRAIRDICLNFNINEEWLRHGTGDKYSLPVEINDITNILAQISVSDNKQILSITSKLLTLNDKYLDLVEKLIDTLEEKDQ